MNQYQPLRSPATENTVIERLIPKTMNIAATTPRTITAAIEPANGSASATPLTTRTLPKMRDRNHCLRRCYRSCRGLAL